MNKRACGALGEQRALDIYIEQGYTLIARNWHFHRMGEIDLILKKNDMLIFCEVKLRSDITFAPASLSVTKEKQARIRKLASCFLINQSSYRDSDVRFDVAEVFQKQNGLYEVNILQNAF